MLREDEQDIIGQPIKGYPDCYRVGPGQERYQVGAVIHPQGNEGPAFQKTVETDRQSGQRFYVWRHIEGQVAPSASFVPSLENLFGAPERRTLIEKFFGVPPERAAAIHQAFDAPAERSRQIVDAFGAPSLGTLGSRNENPFG